MSGKKKGVAINALDLHKVRHADGAAHFSELKWFDRSPLHYLEATRGQRSKPPTTDQLLGTCVHYLVLGPRGKEMIVPWTGSVRAGSAYKSFVKEHGKLAKSRGARLTVVTQPMWDLAQRIAQSVKDHPSAGPLIGGEGISHEVPLRWTDEKTGIELATEGVDFMRIGYYLGDLKTVSNAQPDHLLEHAWTSRWHVQAAMYLAGCEALKMSTERAFVVAVETSPPFALTVLRYGFPLLQGSVGVGEFDLMQHARNTFRTWLDRLQACEASGHWPGYLEEPADWVIPDRVIARMQARYRSIVDFGEEAQG